MTLKEHIALPLAVFILRVCVSNVAPVIVMCSLHAGSIHHVIQYVHGDGPVGQHGILQEGDEILEVGGGIDPLL